MNVHSVCGVSHAKGAAVVIQPGLWTGITVHPNEGHTVYQYFDRFLI